MTRGDDATTAGVADLDEAELDGDVLVDVDRSSLNYKDAMVAAKDGRLARRSPLVAGVDAAGHVAADPTGTFAIGTAVIAHGHGFGTSHHGGLAPRLRTRADWLVAMPDGLDARTSMAMGTAGYTAMASLLALEDLGLAPGTGELLVTGASGGVGSVAVALAAARGHAVVAVSGKPDAATWLRGLGASDVVGRDALAERPDRVLGPEHYAGAIDCVGGATLAQVLRLLRWGGAVAASGLVAGAELSTTVYPFITRNVALVGIDSVDAPAELRARVWSSLAQVATPAWCERLVTAEIGLDGVTDALDALRAGRGRGRVVVDPSA